MRECRIVSTPKALLQSKGWWLDTASQLFVCYLSNDLIDPLALDFMKVRVYTKALLDLGEGSRAGDKSTNELLLEAAAKASKLMIQIRRRG
jgi:hypothetical protein